MTGNEFLNAMSRKICLETGVAPTERQLATRLGVTVQGLSLWRSRTSVTSRQMVGLISKIEAQTVHRTEANAIQPIVEFLRLAPRISRGGVNTDIFRTKDDDGKSHPYLTGLRRELVAHHGIYIFHDSRGRALYAGKARKQKLWKEINLVYNRERTVQTIKRVDHPTRRQDFATSDELRRQIRERSVLLHEMSAYISAYKVADGLINELESLLIRGFPNDLLNARMERFSWN